MSKKKIRTTNKSGNLKDTSVANTKTLSMPTGLNSMMNWLAGLLLIVSFILFHPGN